MSDNTAGGPPPDENEPTPQNPYASTPDPDAAPPPSEPVQPVTPPVTPPAQPTPPTAPPVTPPTAPPVAPPPYGAPTPPPAAPPYGAPAGGQPPVAPPPGGGGYPPPGGGYPPAGGGYPPPGGAYPPPGQPAYAGAAPFAVGDAIGFGWKKFWANPWPWVLAMLIFLLINTLFSWLSGGFDRLGDYTSDNYGDSGMFASFGLSFLGILLTIVGVIISYLIAAFYSRGALDETQGRKPDVAAFFRIANVGNVLLAAFFVAVMSIIGYFLCILPGIAVGIFSAFVYYFTLDKQQDAITAIKSSWSLVAKNFGSVFLLLLALLGINIVGFLVCLIGLLVTLPLSYIAVAYAYRRLIGEQPV